MKKILAGLILGGLLVSLFLPLAVSQAQEVLPPDSCKMAHTIANCPASGNDCDFDSTTYDCGICCMLNTIYTVTNWIFYILILVAVIMIILGGFVFMTAAGSPEKTAKGRNIVVYAVIGIAIAIIAKLVPVLVRTIIGF